MKTLKLIAYDVAGNYLNVDNPDNYKDDFTKSLNNNDNVIISSWWYLHGKLEDEVGFDKAEFCNLGDFETITEQQYYNGNKKTFDVVFLKEGIYDVEVIGFDKPCVGYFWIDKSEGRGNLRGLVCFKDDINAIEYAKKKI